MELPPIYKVFISCFSLGPSGILREQYFDEGHREYFDVLSYNFYNGSENTGFSHFIESSKAVQVYESCGLADMHYEMKLLPFAAADGNGIFVSMDSSTPDKIFWDRSGGKPVLIADNAFAFVRDIQIKPVSDEYLYNDVKHDALYRKFGEAFWRHK